MRLYIIGAGAIARQHGRAVAASAEPFSELHVCDPAPSALTAFKESNTAFKIWDSAEAMLKAAPQADDLVIVATPPSSHVDLGVSIMLGGRNALIEKPLALSQADLRRLLDAAASSGKRFADCSARFLHSPAADLAATLLTTDQLGRVGHIRWFHRNRRSRPGIEYQPQSPWFLDKSLAGGGILLDWAPYDLGLLFQLFKPVAFEVRHAFTSQFINGHEPANKVNDVETQITAACVLVLKDGAKIQLSYERASAVYGREESLAEIEGARGAFRMDWLGWIDAGRAFLSTDDEGKPKDVDLGVGPGDLDLQFKPLAYFSAALRGQANLGFEGAEACYLQACVLALASAAERGHAQIVQRSDWVKA